MSYRALVLYCFLCFGFFGFSQEIVQDSAFIDTKYREDQFYVGGGYNLLSKKPNNLAQTGFSSFINMGFIRDFPVNDRRNFGFGLGIGYTLNSFNQNMLIGKNDIGEMEYVILSETSIDYSKNRFYTHILEIPFEIRWRTSTPEKYNFTRIYFGLKTGYVFGNRSTFKGNNTNQNYSGIKDFNNIQYGLTLSVGYDTWNAHIYYGLNSIFKDGVVTSNDESIDMKSVRIGLIFYLL